MSNHCRNSSIACPGCLAYILPASNGLSQRKIYASPGPEGREQKGEESKFKVTARTFDFKAALEHNRIADVNAWERKTLPENLAAKRVRILSQAS